MESSLDLVSGFKEFDTANQVFGVIDEITDNFQNRFEEAQSRRSENESFMAKERQQANQKPASPTSWRNADGTPNFEDKRDQINKHLNQGEQKENPRAKRALRGRERQGGNSGTSAQGETASSTQQGGASEGNAGADQSADGLMGSMDAVRIDAEDALRIQATLQSLSQQARPAASNYEKLSKELLSALKGNGLKGEKAGEGFRGSQGSSSGLGEGQESKESSQGKNLSEAARSDYADKLNKMKKHVMEQVRFQMKMSFKDGVGDVNIRLRPEMLGQVKVHLMLESSSATANFLVENNTVKEILQENLGELKDALKSQGIEVDQVDVSVADHGDQTPEGGNGFSSSEDLQALKDWVNSFYRYGEAASAVGAADEETGGEEGEVEETDDLLNIIA